MHNLASELCLRTARGRPIPQIRIAHGSDHFTGFDVAPLIIVKLGLGHCRAVAVTYEEQGLVSRDSKTDGLPQHNGQGNVRFNLVKLHLPTGPVTGSAQDDAPA